MQIVLKARTKAEVVNGDRALRKVWLPMGAGQRTSLFAVDQVRELVLLNIKRAARKRPLMEEKSRSYPDRLRCRRLRMSLRVR
jgi:hypothetical protein